MEHVKFWLKGTVLFSRKHYESNLSGADGHETNYPRVIKAAEDGGYDRYFGFEYWPTYDNEQSLKDILAYVKG